MENNEAIVNSELQTTSHSEGQDWKQEFDYEKAYKALQPEYDRWNDEKYKLALELTKANKWSLLSMSTKVQNKVIKELYWLNNIEELKLIHWDNFFTRKNDEEEEKTDNEKLLQEIKLIKYNQTKNEIDSEIENLKKENKELFLEWWAEDKLREELKYLSDNLPIKERIKRAAKIALMPNVDNTTAAYLKVIWTSWNFVNGWNNNEKQITEVSKQISDIFWRYKNNK